jgi:prefoldin alpha subunit
MDKMIQRKYMQMQMLRQQLEGMVQEKNMLNERLGEVAMTMDAIKRLEGLNKGDEMWSTLGSGVFIGADIKDKESVLVSVGSGIVVRATSEDASNMIDVRFRELMDIDKKIEDEMNKYAEQINSIEIELQRMIEQEKESKK